MSFLLVRASMPLTATPFRFRLIVALWMLQYLKRNPLYVSEPIQKYFFDVHGQPPLHRVEHRQ
jgi:hypothetical protein